MIKVDLHTHSVASPDGGITLNQYTKILQLKKLNQIAITDHNTIEFAQQAQRLIGKNTIIVGEEIQTKSGEIIGLYLTNKILSNLTIKETIKEIKAQKGLVYIPHPLERLRKGVSMTTLIQIADSIDILETYNGRDILQKNTKLVQELAQKYSILTFASSDAHTSKGLGCTYTIFQSKIIKTSLANPQIKHTLTFKRPPLYTLLTPKFNRFKNKLYKVNK